MKLSTYFIRAGKYIIQFIILLFVMIGLMSLLSKNPTSNMFETLFTTRGLLLWGVVLLFSLTYPFFGFVKRTLTFDATKHAQDVDKVMEMCGFVKLSDADGVTIYRAKNVTKKLVMLYEDKITITTVDGLSTIEGFRKEVVKASMRFNTFIGV